MRTVACKPGSLIVAGSGGPWPPDWFLGYAASVQKRWGRTIVTDVSGKRWTDVGVIPAGAFAVVEAVHQGVRYPAARPRRGLSQAAEPASAAMPGRVGVPAAAALTSTR